jgi:hypothetical protein
MSVEKEVRSKESKVIKDKEEQTKIEAAERRETSESLNNINF